MLVDFVWKFETDIKHIYIFIYFGRFQIKKFNDVEMSLFWQKSVVNKFG